MESELKVAREIQLSIIPKTFPPFPGRPEFDIYGVLKPAREVGGDFYDFFLLDEDNLCFTIGVVSGKGVPASLFMAVTRTLIKAKSDIGMSPDKILSAVNDELCKDNDSGMFVTVFFGILNISTGEITYSNAAHNSPYILRRDESSSVLPRMDGIALGAMEGIAYKSDRIRLEPGDTLVMYTDGVTEAMNSEGELSGEKRLEGFLMNCNGLTVREKVDMILSSTGEFAGEAEQSDDITILTLKYLGRAECKEACGAA